MRKIRILCYIFPSERGCFLTEINIIKWEPFPTKVGSLTAKPNSNPGHLFKQPGVAPRSHDNSNIFYILYINICLGQYEAEMLYDCNTYCTCGTDTMDNYYKWLLAMGQKVSRLANFFCQLLQNILRSFIHNERKTVTCENTSLFLDIFSFHGLCRIFRTTKMYTVVHSLDTYLFLRKMRQVLDWLLRGQG